MKVIVTICILFWLSSCVPVAIGAGVYHSAKSKEAHEYFMTKFHQTNAEREAKGLKPLDWCSEAYHFDKKWAMKDKNCKRRIEAYEAGNLNALDPNVPLPLDDAQLDDSIKSYTKTIELNPKDAEAYYNRGLAYKKKGNLKQSQADYEKAVELNPDFAKKPYE